MDLGRLKAFIGRTGHSVPERPSIARVVETIKRQYGLKQLFCGDGAVVDFIFIHGLNGDREQSWTAKNNVLWMRDLLPEKIPQARILTYGYNAYTNGDMPLTNLFLHDHAETFIAKLVLFRQDSATEKRPIIFIAHSLGGILLKSALLHANLSHSGHLAHNLDIIDSTYGIFFMGTPHQGTPSAQLGQFVLNVKSIFIDTNSFLLQHLRGDSEALQRQLVEYKSIAHKFKTIFFYEMHETELLGSVAKKLIVPKESAVVPGTTDVEAIAIEKDHVELVKYMSTDDEDYRTVSGHLSKMVKDIIKQKSQDAVADGRVVNLQYEQDSPQIIPTNAGVSGPIATGRYFIRNAHSGNFVALLNDDDRSDVVAVIPGLVRSMGDQWDVVLLDTWVSPPRYSIQNIKYTLFGSCDGRAEKGGNICGKDVSRAWVIKETNKKGQYIISPTTDQDLFWGIPDGEHGTPLVLQDWGVNARNQWIFQRVGDAKRYTLS